MKKTCQEVNCPAPSRCMSSRSGLIGVVPGACRFQQATADTPCRLIVSTCPFRSVPRDVRPATRASELSQRGEACRSPGRSIPDILLIVNIEIDGLFQRYGSNPVYGPPNHESYGKRRNSVVQPAFRPASTPVIKLAYKCVAAHRFVHARTWRFRAFNVVSLAVSAHVDSI